MEKKHRIVLEIQDDLYKKLIERAEQEGFSILTDYIINVLARELSGEPSGVSENVLDKIKSRVLRIVEDQMNKYMELISGVKNQVAELYEKVDRLENEINEIKRSVETPEKAREAEGRKPKSGIERLREEKIVFESKLPPRLRSDRFFNYLEREGAKVLYLKERIAVDKDYWSEFKNKLFNIDTDDEDSIKNTLDPLAFELFKILRDESIIYYDPIKKKWLPLDKDVFK